MWGAENTTWVGKDSGDTTPELSSDPVINLDQGDPMMFESYWKRVERRGRLVVSSCELMSYFSREGHHCWFMEPEFEESVQRLHGAVGNAVTEGRYLVVGTGSSQLYLAALYALCSPGQPHPVSVVCAAPYYSSYAETTKLLHSKLFEWEGDANTFDKEGPYIELVTTPNNPDGSTRKPVINRGGDVIHDLAYYWPHYTPITNPADHHIMLFTFSKCTGHAGTRIGWAIVKDEQVARRMVKYLEISTIGVSKESQLRAARIIGAVCDEIEAPPGPCLNFFLYAKVLLSERWEKLREAVKQGELFTISKFAPAYCVFSKEYSESHPGFAWMTCKVENVDCSGLLREHKIQTRCGKRFGSDTSHVRLSMLSKDDDFNVFLERLAKVKQPEKRNTCNGHHKH